MTEQIAFYDHPIYKLREDDWCKYRDLYVGGHDILTAPQYLWKHEFESDLKAGPVVEGGTDVSRANLAGSASLYAIRKLRTRYVNYMRPIINRYRSLLFKQEPDLEGVRDVFGDEIDDVDGEGTSLLNFITDHVATEFFLYGKVGILTDSFDVDEANMISKAAQQALKMRPYFQILTALEMHDWQRVNDDSARKGRLEWLRTEYTEIADRESANDKPEERVYSKVYNREGNVYGIKLYKGPLVKNKEVLKTEGKGNWEFVEQIAINTPTGSHEEIPIALIDDESFVRDVVEVALLRHNTQSSLDNILLNQAHQKVFGSGDWESGDALVVNEAVMTLLPKDFDITIVEPCNPQALERRLASTTQTLFQLAFSRTRVLPSDAKAVEGAETQREAKEEFLACLKKAGNQIEALVNEAVEYYAAFKGQTVTKPIEFSKDITVEDVDQQLAIEMAYMDKIQDYPIWRKETLKKRAREMNLSNVDAIIAEIDTVEPKKEERTERRRSLFAENTDGEEGDR